MLAIVRRRLFLKLLAPFVLLLVIVGTSGTIFVVRELGSRAREQLDRQLFRSQLDVEASVRDTELMLVETVRFASALADLEPAMRSRDLAAVDALVRSALVVRSQVDAVVVTDADGRGLVEIARTDGGVRSSSGATWSAIPAVAAALADSGPEPGFKHASFAVVDGVPMLVAAGPIGTPPTGIVVAARSLRLVMTGLAGRGHDGVALYDESNARIVASEDGFAAAAPAASGSTALVRREVPAGCASCEEMAVLYAPLALRDTRVGTLAIRTRVAPATASVRGATRLLAALLALVLAVVVLIGALVTRRILAQVRPLVEANRRFGEGSLEVRAPVVSSDELGELALGFNEMAAQLQEMYERLETKVRERTEQLETLNADVEHRSRVRSEFFTGIAHDMRTPMFAIMGHASMMRDERFRPRGDQWRHEFASTIEEAGEHVLALLNQILDFAQMESGELRVSPETIALGDAIGDVRKTLAPLARDGKVTIRVEVPPTTFVRADPTRFRQILFNVLSNAIKYTPPKGRITITAEQTPDHVGVVVADTGIGIPPDAIQRVFDPFFRVDSGHATGKRASSGLGLALTKRLVESHGGEIRIDSAEGKGTTVSFTLPRENERSLAPRK